RSLGTQGGAIRRVKLASRARARRTQQFHTWPWTVVPAVISRNISAGCILRLQKVAAKPRMLGYSLSAMRAQADSVSILQSSTGKTAGALPPGTLQRTLAIIMGGGAGSRLFPLTKDRAKPAVPIGGKYRIVDIPISNCLNSGLRSIYVLTQFNSMSLHQHIRLGADITLATKPVARHQVFEFGIMRSGVDRRITGFIEKPSDESGLQEMKMSRELLQAIGSNADEELFQASMGIYVFNRNVLIESLENDLFDFGKHIIPESLRDRHVSAFIFEGYWADI